MITDTELAPVAPRHRMPRWPFVLLGILVAIGLTIVLVFPMRLDYVAFSPGSVEDVDGYISVEGDTFDADGELYFLTITSSEVNVFEYIEAFFDEEVDLTERQRVRPDDISKEEFDRRNLASMQESQRAAAYVAFTSLGYEPTGKGGLVTDLVDDSPAIGKLEIGDIIVGLNGEEVTLAEEIIDIMSTLGPGDEITLSVLTGEDDTTPEDVDLVLGTNPDDPDRGLIGIFLTTAIEFPFDVAVDSGNIGGPSAGLMWTLGIMNLLSEEDLTKGHLISGTGTIRFDGDVGPIGGVRQKVYAAMAGGAEYALVPAENYEDALEAADDEIEVVSVDTIEDALVFLEELEPVERFAAGG